MGWGHDSHVVSSVAFLGKKNKKKNIAVSKVSGWWSVDKKREDSTKCNL